MTEDDSDAASDLSDSSSGISQLRSLKSQTQNLSKASEQFGKSITNAFSKGIVEGKRFEDVLRNVGKAMTDSLLKMALKPLQSSLSSLLSSSVTGLTGLLGGNTGAASSTPAPSTPAPSVPTWPFADGGVIASPSYFPLGRGLGLMGESGAEAIMPLARGPDGSLGVRGAGAGGRPLAVTVQVSTPDADSFRRSEAQVSAAIARAVARGSRAL